MEKLFLLFIFVITCGQKLVASTENLEIVTKGYRLKSTSAYKDYTFIPYELDVSYLSKQIKKVNYQLSKAEVDDLAQSISRVTNCLNIDSWILTALIQKESSFVKGAVSSTNAAGLTQFTTAGINEVHDQLGLNGNRGAPVLITEYYRNKVLTCINPSWIDPWLLVAVPTTDIDFFNQMKEVLKENPLIAITYGAILLKTYVANLDNRNSTNNNGHSVAEIYYQALQNYNGEPGDAKTRYASAVFNHVIEMHPSPELLDFPFLK